jgi:hypothetical protein
MKSVLRPPHQYKKIKHVPIYEPTEEEFNNPIQLISKLKKYQEYGAVVIKAPKLFRPTCMFDELDKKVSTRVQVIQDLTLGKVKLQTHHHRPSAYCLSFILSFFMLTGVKF